MFYNVYTKCASRYMYSHTVYMCGGLDHSKPHVYINMVAGTTNVTLCATGLTTTNVVSL